MTYFLGIDGGGTGCRAALADAAGTVLSTGEAGPANINTDFAAAHANIMAASREAVARAFGRSAVDDTLPRLCAGLGLAGANAAGVAGRMRLDLPFRQARIETDAVTMALGALGERDGIVAAIGTGSVFASIRGGVFRQAGGWGFVLGDEGSAASLGRALLAAALRAQDGHTGMTPLLARVLEDHGGPSGIVTFAQSASPADFAALAPRVTGSDDAASRAIMAAATDHVAGYIRLLWEGTSLPVVFTGGLGPVYRQRLGHSCPWMVIDPRGTALDGALILARRAA